MIPNTAFAGNIIGIIKQMSSPAVSKIPHSPFVRARSAEQILQHSESKDSSMFAVVYLEAHKSLLPASNIQMHNSAMDIAQIAPQNFFRMMISLRLLLYYFKYIFVSPFIMIT